MAFATKYQMTFRDYEDNTWYVYFQEDGFAGSVTEFTPGADPVNINWNASNKYQPIVGSFAHIQMVYESDMDSLYTEESDTIYVIIKKAADTKWEGFLSPGQYVRQFNEAKHYVTFTASDGLGELKNIKFLDDSDDPYFYQQTEISIIADILAKTNISNSILEAVDVFESGYDTAATDSTFLQTYIYTGKYYNEITEESQDCYTVLEEILKKYGATIRQWAEYWRIMRPNAASLDTIRYRIFNSAGAYASNGTLQGYDTISSLNMVYLNADAELTKQMGVGSAEISMSPMMRQNMLKNGIFNSWTWSEGNPYYWTNSSANYNNTADTSAITIGTNEAAAVPANYLHCGMYLWRAKSVRLTLEYKCVYTGTPTHAKVCLGMIVDTGNYFAPSAGTWHTDAYPTTSNVAYDLIADSKASMTDYETLVVEPTKGPYEATEGGYGQFTYLDIRLYELHNETNPMGGGNYVGYRHIMLEVEYDNTAQDKYIYTYDGPNTINNIHKDELKLGDSFIDDVYAGAGRDDMFFGVTSDAAGGSNNETDEWYIRGDNPTVSTEIPIAELYAKQMVEGQHRSLDVLRATFDGGESLINYHGIQDANFTDSYGYNKTFFSKQLTWNIRPVQWFGEWVECPVVYTDEEMEWDSHDCGGDAAMTANSIEINSWTSGGAGYFAYFDSYTAVAGETIRAVITFTDDGSSYLPGFFIDEVSQVREWGVNRYTYYFSTAGVKTFRLYTSGVQTVNCTAVLDIYSITGI